MNPCGITKEQELEHIAIEQRTQHTPGPWKVHNNIGRKGELGIIANGAPCVIACMSNVKAWPVEAAANAKLIAAAPELLEALKECVTEEGASAERSHAFALKRLAYITEVSRAAIARAEGRIA